jgi:hypothetical protein
MRPGPEPFKSPLLSKDDLEFIKGGAFYSDSATPGAPLSALEHAPKFYSALDRAVEALPEQTKTGQQWLSQLWEPPSKKTIGVRDENNRVIMGPDGKPTTKEVEVQGRSPLPGVKQEELEHSGLLDFLAAKRGEPVTRAELQRHLADNGVKLGEVEKSGSPPAWEHLTPQQRDRFSEIYQERFDDHTPRSPNWPGVQDFYERYRAEAHPNALAEVIGPIGTKYHDYQLPGGENYREKLLTLPSRTEMVKTSFAVEPDGRGGFQVRNTFNNAVPYFGKSEAEAGEIAGRLNVGSMNARGESSNYRSSHWDEPNVLVHRRSNERMVTGPDGRAVKSLHGEEWQSDWHQQGRKQGYKSTAQGKEITQPEFEEYQRLNRLTDLNPAQEARPRRPVQEELARAGAEGCDPRGGGEGAGPHLWTPGEAQAARYDLSKQVDRVRTRTGQCCTAIGWQAVARKCQHKPDGGDYMTQDKIQTAALGKEAADKIVNRQGKRYLGRDHELLGDDLKVGGEGMKGFYDKIIPDAMNKIGKPHGAKVQTRHP